MKRFLSIFALNFILTSLILAGPRQDQNFNKDITQLSGSKLIFLKEFKVKNILDIHTPKTFGGCVIESKKPVMIPARTAATAKTVKRIKEEKFESDCSEGVREFVEITFVENKFVRLICDNLKSLHEKVGGCGVKQFDNNQFTIWTLESQNFENFIIK